MQIRQQRDKETLIEIGFVSVVVQIRTILGHLVPTTLQIAEFENTIKINIMMMENHAERT